MIAKIKNVILISIGNIDFSIDAYHLSDDLFNLTRGLYRYNVLFDWGVNKELSNEQLMQEFDIAHEISTYTCDEVWVFGSSDATVSMGGNNAFWMGTVPVKSFDSIHRRFPFMRFGPEYVLKTYARRVENTMYRVYRGFPPAKNMWESFISSDPEQASCGSILRPPNGILKGYSAKEVFLSDADDWLHYPALDSRKGWKFMDCSEWGCTEDGYVKWWLRHIPHGTGKTDGVYDNWWAYVMNLDLVK
jgi:hypothetical protein